MPVPTMYFLKDRFIVLDFFLNVHVDMYCICFYTNNLSKLTLYMFVQKYKKKKKINKIKY